MDQINAGFARVNGDIKGLRAEMREGFSGVDERFKKVDERFNKVDERFNKVDERFNKVDERLWRLEDHLREEFKAVRAEMSSGFIQMQRTLILFAGGIIAALLASPHL